MKPRLLDLFCCEGGAARGYADAGFEVIGIDIKTQRRYPFGFLQGDAIQFLRNYGREFDVIHASPPCQRYSVTNAKKSDRHPDLIDPVREALRATGRAYVIENVVGAPLKNPVQLCWTSFYEPGSVLDDDGTPLQMFRHRLFESNVFLTAPGCNHRDGMQVAGSYGGARRDKREARYVRKGGYVPGKRVQERLLGIDWMTQYGLYQSVPPAYTEWIGRQLMTHLREVVA